MREVKYQKRHRSTPWLDSISTFLKSRGFFIAYVDPKDVSRDKLYIQGVSYTIDGDLSGHVQISRGTVSVHDPGFFIQKHLKPKNHVCKIIEEYYLEIQ
jgi:hypothetical protein